MSMGFTASEARQASDKGALRNKDLEWAIACVKSASADGERIYRKLFKEKPQEGEGAFYLDMYPNAEAIAALRKMGYGVTENESTYRFNDWEWKESFWGRERVDVILTLKQKELIISW